MFGAKTVNPLGDGFSKDPRTRSGVSLSRTVVAPAGNPVLNGPIRRWVSGSRSEVPESEQRGTQAGGDDPVICGQPGIGVPEVGELLFGVRNRDRLQIRPDEQEMAEGSVGVRDRDGV